MVFSMFVIITTSLSIQVFFLFFFFLKLWQNGAKFTAVYITIQHVVLCFSSFLNNKRQHLSVTHIPRRISKTVLQKPSICLVSEGQPSILLCVFECVSHLMLSVTIQHRRLNSRIYVHKGRKYIDFKREHLCYFVVFIFEKKSLIPLKNNRNL